MGTAVALALLASCDDKPEAERWKAPEYTLARKNVLVEDFTGQKCVNCPKAAELTHTLQQTYGADRVIAVAIHGGSLAYNENQSKYGLANDLSEEYTTHWGVESWPKGMIDRSGGLLDFAAWTTQVTDRFKIEPKVDLTIDDDDISYDAATQTISLTVNIKGNENADGFLQVWLTENGIVNRQSMPNGQGTNNAYVHNHVLRASISEPYGDALSVNNEETVKKTYSYTLPDVSGKKNNTPWNVNNLQVVVFFYNNKDGVMQVIEHPLISNTNN